MCVGACDKELTVVSHEKSSQKWDLTFQPLTWTNGWRGRIIIFVLFLSICPPLYVHKSHRRLNWAYKDILSLIFSGRSGSWNWIFGYLCSMSLKVISCFFLVFGTIPNFEKRQDWQVMWKELMVTCGKLLKYFAMLLQIQWCKQYKWKCIYNGR